MAEMKDILNGLKKEVIQYQKANKEYWKSIYDLEQYVARIFCTKDEYTHVELIDDCIFIQTTTITTELKKFKQILTENGVPFDWDVEGNCLKFSVGVYDLVWNNIMVCGDKK